MQMKLLLAVLLRIMAHFLLLLLCIWVVVVFSLRSAYCCACPMFPTVMMERMMSIMS